MSGRSLGRQPLQFESRGIGIGEATDLTIITVERLQAAAGEEQMADAMVWPIGTGLKPDFKRSGLPMRFPEMMMSA
jgi:hypothetical protein